MFKKRRRHEMASKKSKSQSKSGAAANTGRRMIKKATFRDLEAKDGQQIRGGKWSRDNGSVSSSTSSS
jgi:hypothetical protein